MRLRLSFLALTLVAACSAPQPDRRPAESAAVAGQTASPDSARFARADASRILGADSAQVWMLIVSDFQCPYCRMWHEQSFAALQREYVATGKVRMAYINLPIQTHQNAKPAAEAAMCAGMQGKFWQVADGIFTTQPRWSTMPIASAIFDSIAGAQAIDMPQWRECVEQHHLRELIEADAARANQIGIGSTPSFLILRDESLVRSIAGAFPLDTFRVALDAALSGAGPAARP